MVGRQCLTAGRPCLTVGRLCNFRRLVRKPLIYNDYALPLCPLWLNFLRKDKGNKGCERRANCMGTTDYTPGFWGASIGEFLRVGTTGIGVQS